MTAQQWDVVLLNFMQKAVWGGQVLGDYETTDTKPAEL